MRSPRRDVRARAHRCRRRPPRSGRRAPARAPSTSRAASRRRRSRRAGHSASPPSDPAPGGGVHARVTYRCSGLGTAPSTVSSASRLWPCTRCWPPPAGRSPPWRSEALSVGSELESSAGPSTTPSAATAVRSPAIVSAATGGCSITSIRRPWGKRGIALTDCTTGNEATAARSAAGWMSSVLMCSAAPAQRRLDRLRLRCRAHRSPARARPPRSEDFRSNSQPPASNGSATSTTEERNAQAAVARDRLECASRQASDRFERSPQEVHDRPIPAPGTPARSRARRAGGRDAR